MTNVRWAFNINKWEPSEREFMLASSCLQAEEKKRIEKFAYKKDVKASLSGRLMIRKFICQFTGLPYNSIIISRDMNNKPVFISNSKNLVSFNVSHQGSFTVLAGEKGSKNVGVDLVNLEYKREKSVHEYFKTMSKVFSDLEWQKIRSSSEINNLRIFFRNWALKESYLKAIGKGITVDLKKVCFRINSELCEDSVVSDSSLYLDNVKQNWIFEESLVDPLHCAVVALESNCWAPKSLLTFSQFQEISAVELLENVVPILPCDSEYCKKYFFKY